MIALMDCNNFFASCERIFDLKLKKMPLVILSNNDGCVIARSNEVKALGIKTGDPYFKIKHILTENKVAIRSSNYELYGDISRRIMSLASNYSPDTEQYSIDEIFLNFSSKTDEEYLQLGASMRTDVLRQTSIPTSIGFASSKTLAKIANHIAKKSNSGIYVMPTNNDDILSNLDVSEVWGIGRRTHAQLIRIGIRKAIQLRDANQDMLKEKFSITVVRTAQELGGKSCFTMDTQVDPPQSVSCSRMFGRPISDFNELTETIATYIGIGAEKLREAKQRATGIQVYFQKTYGSNDFDPHAYFVGTTLSFSTPLNETHEIIKQVIPLIYPILEEGARYRKSGISFMGLQDESRFQGDLFATEEPVNYSKLYQLMDNINNKLGKRTLFHLAEGLNQDWKMRREWVSPRFTTQWHELPKVK